MFVQKSKGLFNALNAKNMRYFARFSGGAELDPLKHINMRKGFQNWYYEDAVDVGEYPTPDRLLKSDLPMKYYYKSKDILLQFIESKKVREFLN